VSTPLATIHCPFCHKHVAVSAAPVEARTRGSVNHFDMAVWVERPREEWWIGICPACFNPLLVCNHGEIVFPNPQPSPTASEIPDVCRKALIEAKLCLTVHAWNAAAAMARRSLQAACKERGCTGRNLVDQIDDLATKGLVTAGQRETVHMARVIGNYGAHPDDALEIDQEEAEGVVELCEDILHNLYVIPARTLAQQQRFRGKGGSV